VLRISAFILSSLILLQSVVFSSTAVVEVASFIEHYNFHKQTEDDSFIEFVSLHYGDLKNQHQNDHPEHHDHQQLPLHNFTSSTILFVATIDTTYENDLEFSLYDSYLNNFRYTPGSSSFNPLDLIQPPRIA
jgi:hypothetical protein